MGISLTTVAALVLLAVLWLVPPIRRRLLPRYRALALASFGAVVLVESLQKWPWQIHLVCAAAGFLVGLSAFLHVRSRERKDRPERGSLAWRFAYLQYLPAILVAVGLLAIVGSLLRDVGSELESIRQWGGLFLSFVLLIAAYSAVFFLLLLWISDSRSVKQ